MPNDPEDFKNNNGMNTPNGNDDFVDSSFAIQFKPGDKAESVSDKLKVTKENLDKKIDEVKPASDAFQFSSTDNGFKDEFDDFEFDASISAFKPFKAPEPEKTEPKSDDSSGMKFEPTPEPKSSDPVFPKDGGTFDKPIEIKY